MACFIIVVVVVCLATSSQQLDNSKPRNFTLNPVKLAKNVIASSRRFKSAVGQGEDHHEEFAGSGERFAGDSLPHHQGYREFPSSRCLI